MKILPMLLLTALLGLGTQCGAAENVALAGITVGTTDAIRVLPLAPQEPRLYDSNPLRVIEKVRANLAGAQFISIPQRIINQYQIQVDKAGVIYAFGGKAKTRPTCAEFLGENDARWVRDDGAVAGKNLVVCFRREVAAGETIVLHGFELQLAAGSIVVAGPGFAAETKPVPPSKRIEPLLEPALNAVLAPLQDDPPMPRVPVETLRASLAAGVVTAKQPSQQQAYQCAMAVCDALTSAMDERAQTRAAAASSGLLPSVSNGGSIIKTSPLSGRDAGGAAEAIRRKQKDERKYADNNARQLSNFIDSTAYKSWVTRTAVLRTTAMNLYTKLVQLEAADPAFNPSPTVAAPPPNPVPAPPSNPEPAPAADKAPEPPPPAEASAQPFLNSLGMQFVPAGTPRVLFCIWDTRVKDFAQFIQESGYDMSKGERAFSMGGNGKGGYMWKQQGADWRNPHFPENTAQVEDDSSTVQAEDDPVVCVSWNDANAFCEWLTTKERAAGLLKQGQRYRLPTDHEWSTAAGIGNQEDANASPASKNNKIQGIYPWGTAWPPPKDAGNFAGEESKVGLATGPNWKVVANYNDGFPRTSPVGSFAPNPYGLYDMAGNVWQWCEDRFDTKTADRVQRGGSWERSEQRVLLSSDRNHNPPGDRFVGRGFRMVLAGLDVSPATASTHNSVEYISDLTSGNTSSPVKLVKDGIATTKATFKPPVEILIEAKTNSTNLRMSYAAKAVIFNWERNRTELRVDGGPANGKHKPGAGSIPTNQYVAIRWVVTPSKQTIEVDGQPRYEHSGDYSKINNPVSVFCAHGSEVTVSSIKVRQLPADTP